MNRQDTFTIETPGDRDIVVTRIYDAPRDLVFNAYVDPELVPLWWGSRHANTEVDKMDVRPGGEWRYVCRMPDGRQDVFRGEYREVSPPHRLVFTFEWEGLPGHILEETIEFVEMDGMTKIIDTSVFQTPEDRDGMLQSGMEAGARESLDRLEELLRQQAETS